MSEHVTPHAHRVHEFYRNQGRQQVLDYLIEKGIIREAMFFAGFVAMPVDGEPVAVDLPSNVDTWQPKEKKIA